MHHDQNLEENFFNNNNRKSKLRKLATLGAKVAQTSDQFVFAQTNDSRSNLLQRPLMTS
jgi:hypothetical protein